MPGYPCCCATVKQCWTADSLDPSQSTRIEVDGTMTSSAQAGSNPYAGSICWDGTYMWMGTGYNGALIRVSADKTLTEYTDTAGVAGQNWGGGRVCFDGTHIWETWHGVATGEYPLIAKFNTDGTRDGRYNTDGATNNDSGGLTAICYNGGDYVWATSYYQNDLIRVDIATNAITRYAVGAGNDGPAGIACDGTNLWVAFTLSNTVDRFDCIDGTRHATGITLSGSTLPYGIAYDGSNMWVANYTQNTITKITAGLTVTTNATGVSGYRPAFLCFDGTNMRCVGPESTGGTDVQVLKISPDFTITAPGDTAGGSTQIASEILLPIPPL